MSLSLNYPTTRPSLLLDFSNVSKIDPRITFSRASSATYYDSNGLLRSVSSNTPRLDYNPATLAAQGLLIEEQRTNSIRNNTMVGAVAGTPGSVPTNWPSAIINGSTGLTSQVVEVGAEDGISYIDFRISGTAGGAGSLNFAFEPNTQVVATQNQVWTVSMYRRLIAGSFNGLTPTATNIFLNSYLAAGSFDANATSAVRSESIPTSAALKTQRATLTGTLSSATTARVNGGMFFTIANAAAIDITLRIGLPQLELGAFATSVIPNSPTFISRASAASYYNSTGLLTSAATNVARYNYNPANLTQPSNLILEAAATNLLTYSSDFDNAAWSKNNLTVSANVVASPTGNVDADAFIEDTATAFHSISFAGTSFTSGSAYTFSVFAKLNTRSVLQLTPGTGAFSTGPYANFNLSTGVVSATGAGATASIQNAGGGWYRCTMTATADVTATALIFITLQSSATAARLAVYTGDGVSGIYLYGAQLEAGAFATSYVPSVNTFTSRASTGSYFDSAGVLQSAAINVARNTYNPANLAAQPFLLLEEARTNSFVQSADISNASWLKVRSSTPGATTSAPSGGLAQKLVEDTSATISHFVRQDVVVVSGTTYTQSVFVKAAERSQIQLAFDVDNGAFSGAAVIFTLTGNGATNIVAGTPSYSITIINNGWYRCTITQTAIANTTAVFRMSIADGGTASYTGNGTSGLYIWGAQLEAGAYPTSYIPTTTTALTRAADISSSAQATRAADVYSQAALTRAADVASVNTLSPWFNASEGTLYCESVSNASSVDSTNLVLSDGTNSNRIQFGTGAANTVWNPFVVVSGSSVATLTQSASFSPKTSAKLALAYKFDDFAATTAGASPVTDTSGVVPTLNILRIGASGSGVATWNSWIRRITYYPRALSDAELQSLTS